MKNIYQLFDPLSEAEYEALKEDIKLRGVMVPVEFDESDNVLDGHNRVRIATELEIDYRRIVRTGMTEEEKRSHVRKLNLLRRHLNQEQKRVIIREQIKETPYISDRQIAAVLGVSPTTVGTLRQELISVGDVSNLDTSTDTLGRQQPRERAPRAVASVFCADKREAAQVQKAFDEYDDLPSEFAKEGTVAAGQVAKAAKNRQNETRKAERDAHAAQVREETGVEIGPPASRQHFDVWDFSTRDDTAGIPSYFGALPPQVMENIVWLFTEQDQVVVDPFAGGGTTHDVCRRMGRKSWLSDRKPTRPEINLHDITIGWPCQAPDFADLIFLDPPYWKQAKGRYSEDEEDLGNQTLEEFKANWLKIVETCYDHIQPGGLIAFIISPSVDADENRVVDHAFDMYQACIAAGFKQHRRIIVCYSTQQATGQQVIWARENRQLLKLYRDLVVLKK